MNTLKALGITVLFFLFSNSILNAQGIKAPEGYTTQIGNLVSMLEDLKRRVTYSVIDLDQSATDFLIDEKANRIGAMILHLAATEKYYQVYTFENRNFNKQESEKWSMVLSMGESVRATIKDQPISYYLDIWNKVRNETLRLLKTKDDDWLNSNIEGSRYNNHWAWYHVMEHQANHMGQIRMILGRVPK